MNDGLKTFAQVRGWLLLEQDRLSKRLGESNLTIQEKASLEGSLLTVRKLRELTGY